MSTQRDPSGPDGCRVSEAGNAQSDRAEAVRQLLTARAALTLAINSMDETWDVGECELAEKARESLEYVLHAALCEDCADGGADTVATEKHGDTPLCSDCYGNRSERTHEAMCEDYYGGSGPSDQDRFEAARDSGRRS